MELTGAELAKIEGDAISAVDGELEGILEAVRRQMFPQSVIPKDVKEIALAVGRQSSRSGAQAAARATALLMKTRTVGVETRTQTFSVLFDITTANLPSNVITTLDVTTLDTSYDLVTGMCVVVKTPDPAPAQIPAGAVFAPEIGLQLDRVGVIRELAPRELYMIDRNGTTPVDSRFTALKIPISTGMNLKIMSRFFTPPGINTAVNFLAGQYYVYTVTFELSRTQYAVR